MNVLIIDNIDFSNLTVASVERTATVKDSELSGEMMDGSYHRDIIGTYIDYNMTIVCKVEDHATYAQIYEILTSPTASHEITAPYNNTTMTFQAYIETVSDKLFRKNSDGTIWKDLTVTFKAAAPQKVPV